MGVYGPHAQIKCLLKAKILGHIQETLIYSQMIFYLDERHSLKARVLESCKKCINWVSVGNFKTLSGPYR